MKPSHSFKFLLILTIWALFLAGCTGGTPEAPESVEVASEAEEVISEVKEVVEEVKEEVVDTIEEMTEDQFVTKAKEKIAAATSPSSAWDGPTTGPTAESGKLVVFVAADLRNGGILGVANGVEEAAEAVGWEVRIIDGQGSEPGRTAAFEEALTLKPDGIVLGGFDALEQADGVEEADSLGIPVVGWHSAADPGPVANSPVFANITTDANDVAEIAALYVVAQSNGMAGVVIFTDSVYSVAIAKSDKMASVIEQCTGCTLLSVEDTPLSDTSILMPQLTTSLLQRYGDDWTHSLGINDLYFDFMGPSLEAAGITSNNPPFNLSGGDGSGPAYQRVRDGGYQVGTVPEPLNLHGWQVIDELNRAMNGAEWSGYVTPVKLVTPDNVGFDGGPDNIYDPDNGYREMYLSYWR